MSEMPGGLYIGLMSGTSMDGVDGVLIDFQRHPWQTRAHAHRPFPAELKASLMALNSPGEDEIHAAALAAQDLTRLYAEVVADVCQQAGIAANAVQAIGAHGQTIRHRPECGYTVQLQAPALLAELTSIDVVADFRSRDIAAGGQGAPLVPAFHSALLKSLQAEDAVVLNIGGIANISIIQRDRPPLGFDCGPGNSLMDSWCERHTGAPYDAGGAWGATGQHREAAVAQALSHPYFMSPPPKSTGRDLFNEVWLQNWLTACGLHHAPAHDIQASLCEITARSIAMAIQMHASACSQVIVCGGGAFNQALMQRIERHLPGIQVVPSDAIGLPVMQMEAAAFAWLAYRHVHRLPANEPTVTGARGPRVLGALYPAG